MTSLDVRSLRRARRCRLALAASLLAGSSFCAPAWAGMEESKTDGLLDSVVVTGTRIVRDGYDAPTPVSVLGQAELAARIPGNITDLLDQIPAITASGAAATNSGSLSNGLAGVNAVSLRGLGAGRTLILIDGQRSVASTFGGVVDINTIPQALVERVEIVTGGASAQYGSDAVGGVVNFILDRRFAGLKLTANHGLSSRGDGQYGKLVASAGGHLVDGRLRVLANAEIYRQTAVDTIDRAWNRPGYLQINNPAYTETNGQPQRLVGSGLGPSTYTAGGLIGSGPLRGAYFLGDGATGQLTYGQSSAASAPYMVGGDIATTLAGHAGSNSLLPHEERYGLFGRADYTAGKTLELYVQAGWNRYEGRSNYQQTPSTGVAIQGDNGFLQSQYPAIAAALAAAGTTSFTMGTSNAGFQTPGSDNRRSVVRIVAGARGQLELVGRSSLWNAYYQHGQAQLHEGLHDVWNLARMAQAQDAVIAPASAPAGISVGAIICRSSLANPGNGCVPIDRLGVGGPSAASLAYVIGSPYRHETIRQDVAAASASVDLFSLPGGRISTAFGVEWRRDAIDGRVPQEYQPVVNASTGVTTATWLYGNFLPNRGAYEVIEGFVELDAPVLRWLDLNGAVRHAHYSISGGAWSWKLGATLEPAPGLRLRSVYSRDIRAPNLQELFATGTARSNTVNLPVSSPVGAGAFPFIETTIGNRDLAPERADTRTFGVVFAPTRWPGFKTSIDYFDIRISDAIGTLVAQNVADNCYGLGLVAACAAIQYQGGVLSRITVQPYNFARQHERGLDLEASYVTSLEELLAVPGSISVRGQATHYIENTIDNGVFPIDYAGVNGGSLSGTYNVPSWAWRVTVGYDRGQLAANLIARGVSGGVYGNDYVECQSGCPVSTVRYRTINDNSIAGATYFDASISWKVTARGAQTRLTLAVDNVLDKNPPLIGNGPEGNNWPAYAQTNRYLYDVVGRFFRLSATAQF